MVNVIEYIIRLRNEFSSQAEKVSTSLKNMQQQLSTKLATAGFDDLGAAIGRIPLGMAAIGAGAGAIVGLGKAAFDAAQNYTALALATDKMSQKTGASVEFLSTFTAAAEDAEIATGTINTALTKFSDNLFTVKGASANVEAELYAIADLFSKMPDGPEKTAIAINAFGKAGAEMIPILNQGSAGLKQLQADMVATGNVITKDGVNAAKAFDDAMDGLNRRMTGFANTTGVTVITGLTNIADGFQKAGAEIDVASVRVYAFTTALEIQRAGANATVEQLDRLAKYNAVLAEAESKGAVAAMALYNSIRTISPAANAATGSMGAAATSASAFASTYLAAAARIIEGSRAMAQSMFKAGQAAITQRGIAKGQEADAARYAAMYEKRRTAIMNDTEALRANRLTSEQTDASIDKMNASFEQTVVSGGGAAAAISKVTEEQQKLIDQTQALKGALAQNTDEMDQGEQLQTAYAIATGELSMEQFEQLQAVKGLLQAAKDQKISNEQALVTVLAMREGVAGSTDAFEVAGESGSKFKGEVDAVAGVVAGATTNVANLTAGIKAVPKETKVDLRAFVYGEEQVFAVKSAIDGTNSKDVIIRVKYEQEGSPPGGGSGGGGGGGTVPPPSGGVGPQRVANGVIVNTPIQVNELNPRRAAMLIANAQRQAARSAALRARAGFG